MDLLFQQVLWFSFRFFHFWFLIRYISTLGWVWCYFGEKCFLYSSSFLILIPSPQHTNELHFTVGKKKLKPFLMLKMIFFFFIDSRCAHYAIDAIDYKSKLHLCKLMEFFFFFFFFIIELECISSCASLMQAAFYNAFQSHRNEYNLQSITKRREREKYIQSRTAFFTHNDVLLWCVCMCMCE